ncbi:MULTISPECIES: NAD-glutamate dehydrogenase [Deefgea]|uniref:NAD-glutamate dehydrogenase n=1 Tax=Deefgea chitinilytica TaxID=570276 RepID=A0ABS2CAT3_9NEIS|nr:MULTISPECIES: NAD-glutamate dehydrogenase [Deefgea]MBM5570775.1 NAD-glutamate dehydrogenase [Deefgea chitinilytica]MBM9888004.1 NAD-glutamate dehydrogenase [Deefgea sp. CFH1-16]
MTQNLTMQALQTWSEGNEPAMTTMIQHFYANVPEEDLQEKSIEDLAAAVLAQRRMASKRSKQQRLIRIYNPTLSEHGWQSPHTVIEIVQDDMPFLVDSVGIALNNMKCNVYRVIHPVLNIQRDEAGQLVSSTGIACKESWMHFEINRISDPNQIALITNEIDQALDSIAIAVADWPNMTERVSSALEQLKANKAEKSAANTKEVIAFLEWLLAGHFVFLGLRDYQFDANALNIVPHSGMGLLRDAGLPSPSHVWASLSPDLRAVAYAPTRLLMLTKSDRRSLIHRSVYLDTVLLRNISATGELLGELRIVGLYSASAYTTPPRQIPILRQKIDQALSYCNAELTGYRGKALLNVLDTYPRDELIEIEIPELARIADGIVSLHERQRVRAFFRDDIYRRYVSVMVFVPRDNYSTDVRMKIEALLLQHLAGSSSEFTVFLGDNPLARIHYIIRRTATYSSGYDSKVIEAEIAQVAQRWQDDLKQQLIQSCGEERGSALHQKYLHAFPAAYCADFSARAAIYDIESLETALSQQSIVATLTPGSALDAGIWRLKLYQHHPIELSDCLPLLESLGLRIVDERPYILQLNTESAWLVDIGVRLPAGTSLEHPEQRQRLLAAFVAQSKGLAENDKLNQLVLYHSLAWREVFVLRAYARYLKQVALKYSIEMIADCLLMHGRQTQLLAQAFQLLHHPSQAEPAVAEIVLEEITQAAKAMPNIDDERILTSLMAAIRATLRTNFYQSQGSKNYLALKIASAEIPLMPQPVPMCEIFVYSPQMEGVHLRGGKVARGGLRWSDRREDFRTEVLGLVKAQMVKNTVIVPVGSKGGFVVKNPPLDREAYLASGIACYQMFIRGLLDLTDNFLNGHIVPPADVLRRDGDDPYLVVAADKGTATFSDIANAISQEYNFWLDDAFASGGSVGYDHKKMGITARGAWISVERSFREMGLNTNTDPFTAVGIGDMSGDVFGNGLLRTKTIRLLAAFDHRHIFIDPNPQAETAYAERERLFQLPRSSWADYNPTLISTGGGVFARNLKKIKLSDEMRRILEIEAFELEPDQLIQAILKAPVDLLYNGGIGTYVKSSAQTHAEANDRGNDAVRVDGKDLRCKVIAEGGNLGFTQLGRIEYALHGGRIHTDAIDNSAGVDCSDHEVNIKILLSKIVNDGDLTLKQRNELLASMTDEVGLLVLRDNELQTQAVSLEFTQSLSLLPVHTRLMQTLEQTGKLSRRIEYLPSNSQLAERQHNRIGLSRPELSVLLAYAKIVIKQDLLAENLVDDAKWHSLLQRYFPVRLVEKFSAQIAQHPLRREIVATQLTNHLVNRYGISCIYRLQEETEKSCSDIVDALISAESLLDSESLFLEIEQSDIAIAGQTQLLLTIRRQTERVARWLLQQNLATTQLEHMRTCAALTLPQLPQQLSTSSTHAAQAQEWQAAGISTALAMKVMAVQESQSLLELCQFNNDSGQLAEHMRIYLALGEALELKWLAHAIEQLPRDNRWQTLARLAARDDLQRLHMELFRQVWGQYQAELSLWLAHNQAARARVAAMFAELSAATPDLAMISAVLRELRQRLIL